jgi:cysteinyl-tRNA synthetase
MEIKIFNTLSGKEEQLTTITPDHLKLYVCGPTVYDRPHLGNARSIVVYDLFYRFFLRTFAKVTYVRNITDVDDKINAAAKEQKVSIEELTTKITALFHRDIAALNALPPTYEPRATKHIAEMINIIQKLITNGHAYVNQGHVLFDVNSYKDYGQLSNRNLDDMIAGSRVEIAPYKKNPLDFVLWKPSAEKDDISSIFESPWGKGRPGWHIECSAMSAKYLGDDFDIHGGGADLQFPHHENEIAQSRCAEPHSTFAKFWVHNGFLTVNGEKMSKSLKNFITVFDLLDQGVPGIVIRYFLLSTHYRKPLDFNRKALDDAQRSMEKFYSVLSVEDLKNIKEPPEELLAHLADDLNISKAIAFLHEITKEIKHSNDLKLKEKLVAALDLIGILDVGFFAKKTNIDENYVNEQIELRLKFKQEKNYAEADRIRLELLDKGVALEDVSKDKTLWKR